MTLSQVPRELAEKCIAKFPQLRRGVIYPLLLKETEAVIREAMQKAFEEAVGYTKHIPYVPRPADDHSQAPVFHKCE